MVQHSQLVLRLRRLETYRRPKSNQWRYVAQIYMLIRCTDCLCELATYIWSAGVLRAGRPRASYYS